MHVAGYGLANCDKSYGISARALDKQYTCRKGCATKPNSNVMRMPSTDEICSYIAIASYIEVAS